MKMQIDLLIFNLFIYSFLGWFFESIYKSIKFNKIINSGFLYGPFIPVYGFGALIIIALNNLFHIMPFYTRLIVFPVFLTGLEYITDIILQLIFKERLWDYSKEFFNIKGRICLLHSFIWLFLSYMEIAVFQPGILFLYNVLLNKIIIEIDLTFSVVFIFDFLLSVTIKKVSIIKLQGNHYEYFRNNNIRRKKNNLILLKEYFLIIKDVIRNKEFRELKNIQHHDSSIYNHVLEISYLSYEAGKILNLDYISAARGALLHDFYLYNWRYSKPRDNNNKIRLHAFYHPVAALNNAEKYFTLNDIERDIIVKHMWPLTIKLPVYRESFLVSFIDKIVSLKDVINIIFRYSFTKLRFAQRKI